MLSKIFAVVAISGFVSTATLAAPTGLLTMKPGSSPQTAPTGTLASLLTTFRSVLKNPPIPSLSGSANLQTIPDLPSLGMPLVSTVQNDAINIAGLVGKGRPLELLGSSGVVLDSYIGKATELVGKGK